MQHDKTKELTMTAIMIALIFTATYMVKIPNPATGGYTHLGDCMVFLGVLLLGKSKGALAAGLGGALSDLLSGAPIWVLPTFVIKYLMGWIMGSFCDRSSTSNGWLGAMIGGIFQIVAYTLVKIPLVGIAPALASLPRICLQTGIGLCIFVVLEMMISHTELLEKRRGKRV